MLNTDDVRHLRRPFTPEAVKWRADQKKPDAAGNVRCLVYLDARLTAERITEIDPAWTARFEFLAANHSDPVGHNLHAPTWCHLTVKGVTRSGMGQIASSKPSAASVKSATSDAIKRAGVEFGVGAYLYAMPVFKVDAKGYWAKSDGTVGGLKPEGVKQLRKQYATVVNHPKFAERFGEPTDYGDIADDERSADPVHETLPVSDALSQGRSVKRGGAA